AALYDAERRGVRAELPPLALQPADIAAWERARLQYGLGDAVAWWKAALADVPNLLALPTDRPRPGVQSFRGDSVALELAAPAALRRLGAPAGLSPTLVVLAGFVALLHRYSGE